MARTFDVVVLNIHPAIDKTLVVAEVRYTPTQDNVDLPTAGTGRQSIAPVKQQKTIVHVWGDYRDRMFQAFGHKGVKEAGATLEKRIKKQDKRGTAFAGTLGIRRRCGDRG